MRFLHTKTGGHSTARRILVTGASGFIGQALIQHLAHAGYTVTALSRQPLTLPRVRCVSIADYADGDVLAPLLAGQDVVIHLAALAHQRNATAVAFDSNVRTTEALARACAQAGVGRLVLLSSIGVYGPAQAGRPFTETSPTTPTEPYAVSKLACEQVVAHELAGRDWVIIRPPLVYGPHAPGNFGQLQRAVARGAWLPLGRATPLRSFVGLDNLVDFIALCSVHPAARQQAFVVADGEDVSTADFIRAIGRALGRPARLLNVPLSLLRGLAGLLGRAETVDKLLAPLQVDARLARLELGWTPPYTLAQGLQRAAVPTPAI